MVMIATVGASESSVHINHNFTPRSLRVRIRIALGTRLDLLQPNIRYPKADIHQSIKVTWRGVRRISQHTGHLP
jgi:hypothetical protein